MLVEHGGRLASEGDVDGSEWVVAGGGQQCQALARQQGRVALAPVRGLAPDQLALAEVAARIAVPARRRPGTKLHRTFSVTAPA